MELAKQIEDAWLLILGMDEVIAQRYPAVRAREPQAVEQLQLLLQERARAFDELLRLLELAKLH